MNFFLYRKKDERALHLLGTIAVSEKNEGLPPLFRTKFFVFEQRFFGNVCMSLVLLDGANDSINGTAQGNRCKSTSDKINARDRICKSHKPVI